MFMDKIEDLIKGDPKGFVAGQAISIQPETAKISIDLTTPLGKASGISMGLLFQLSKDGYKIEKIEEALEVSPVFSQYYALTMKQKEELEGKIKAAIASLSAAISDLELLEHDMRKYKEFMDWFELLEEGKREKNLEKIKKADTTLRSIFIDQVDVHTGEGIALKLITTKWPTIITDFMQLTDEDIDPEKIAKKLKITKAEAIVLATKNKLYLEWRKMFRENVEKRYERIKSLISVKEKSIEEIKVSIKPALLRYKSIREIGETEEGRKALLRMSWFRPAGQAVSIDMSKIWAWKTFLPQELYRPTVEAKEEKRKILKIREIPTEFKNWLRAELGKEAEKIEVSISPVGIEPLDKWAFWLLDELQKHYGIKFSVKEIIEIREKLLADYKEMKFELSPYFKVVEISPTRVVMRMPDGSEFEDITFELKAKVESLNIMLVRYAEVAMRDKIIEKYISELLGEKIEERKVEEIIKEEYPAIKGIVKIKKPKIPKVSLPNFFEKFQKLFPLIRRGPYERVFSDRFTIFYLGEVVRTAFDPYVKYLKKSVGVP